MQQVRKYSYFVLLGLCFLLAFFLRTKLYITNDVFSDDECRLALSMINNNFWQSLLYLGQAQSAPPVFVFFTRLITGVFGFTEHAAKFLPYIAGVGSVYFFYRVCTNYLKSHAAIVIASFLFAIAQPLVSFSAIFKQYSLDVLIGLICLYYFPKLKDIDKKTTIILALVIMTLPLISLPSLFFIAAFFIKMLCENWKRALALILPFGILMLVYYVFSLAPAKLDLNTYFPNYWTDGFFGLSLSEFLKLLIINIKFYFIPNDLSLASIILLFWGIYYFIREKNYYILSVFFFILLAAFLKLYPLSGRVGLYALPIFLLFILKPLDSAKKAGIVIASIFIFLSFCKYDFGYIKDIATLDYMVSYSPKNLMMYMKERFNPEKDVILCNSASSPSYLFYSLQSGLDTENIYEMPLNHLDKAASFEYLNGLKSGNYWIYLIKDYRRAEVFPTVFEWLEGTNMIKDSRHERQSYLFYVEK